MIKMISKYFIASGIASIGSIVGISIWTNSNNIFTFSSIYEFYWFVSISSFILSILGYSFHTFNSFIQVVANVNLIHLHIISLTLFGLLYTLFWFSSGVALSQVVRHCSFINQVFNFATDFTCDGEIISMTFCLY